MASWISQMDNAVKSMIFTKFGPSLSLTDLNADTVFCPESIALRKIAEKRGQASVEFISFYRTNMSYDWARNNSFVARKGISLEYSDSTKKTIITATAVPVKIDYEIYFWSRTLDKLTAISELYFKWQHNVPQLLLNYLSIYPLSMYLKFGNVTDVTNYDIYEKGLYFVYKVPLSLDGWLFDTFSSYTVLEIILDIFLREGKNPNYTDTLLDEYIITSSGITPV